MTTAIARLLDACGKPDWQVAGEVGIHPSTVSRYRSGERKPHPAHVDALCGFLEVSPAQLLGEPADLPFDRQVRVTEVEGPRSLMPAGSGDSDEWIE